MKANSPDDHNKFYWRRCIGGWGQGDRIQSGKTLPLIRVKMFSKKHFFFWKSVWNKEKHVGMIAEGEYKPKEYIYNAEKKIKESVG